MIEDGIVYEMILLHADAVMKVKAFLAMVALRRRHLKKKVVAVTI
jgi:hypothetical protein